MAIFKTTQSLIISTFLIFLTSVATHAADATLSWKAINEPVSGYKIYYGTSSCNYVSVLDVNPPMAVNDEIFATVSGLSEEQTYYFAVTAYSADEESDYSVEVIHTVPAAAPPQPPIAGNILLQGSEDTPLSGQLSANGSEGTTLTFMVVSQPDHGTVTVKNDSGSFTYTPAPNYSGNDAFSYTATNSSGTSNPATVNITSNSVNDSPVADTTVFSVNEDGMYTGTLSATDIDGDPLVYSLAARANNGTVTITPNGSFTYIAQHNFFGSDSFTFRVSDGSSISNTAQVNVTIQHINKAPFAQDSSFSVDQGAPYSGRLIATDEDGDVVHFFKVTATEKGTLLIADNGSFTYTPNADASGEDCFTFLATDGTLTSNKGTVNILLNETVNNLAFELGELLVTSAWQHVDFSTEYTSPAVIAKSTTMNDPEASLVSIRNLTNKGFDIRIREWDYAGGFHTEEIVAYMAMEQGRHQIAYNAYAVAECTELSGLNTFRRIKFANSLSSQPVVLSSIVTENEANAVVLRMKQITSKGFSITMQEQENNDGSHAEETVCYIAMEKWSGVVDGLMIEAGSTEKTLTDKVSTISFKQRFPTIPFVLADMQSANGMDTAIVGMSDLSVTDTKMTILEEQSANSEMKHISEIGGYIAVTPYNPE